MVLRSFFSARVLVVVLSALAAGLSLALISLTKVLLLLTCLLVLLWVRWPRETAPVPAHSMLLPVATLWSVRFVLLMLLALGASLLWTSAPMPMALNAMGKYGKLLVIPAFLVLVRSRREAHWALGAFLTGQAVLLLASWALYFQLPVPWATSRMATTGYSVFSSYLDQGIMSAVMGSVFWHMRRACPGWIFYSLSVAFSLLAFVAVFVVFDGRSGHLAGILLLSLAVFWALPPRYRLATICVPPLIFAVAFMTVDRIQTRFTQAANEVTAYMEHAPGAPQAQTSSGLRLAWWRTSVLAIAEKPWLGSGVGSWTFAYDRIETAKNPAHVPITQASNPHQEFLLWGVQLGVGGIALLLAFLAGTAADFYKMAPPVARAGGSVLAGFVVGGMFNASLWDAYIGDFFCVGLGVLLAYGAQGMRSARAPAQFRPC